MSKIDLTNVGFETLMIHAGQSPDKESGALATPIYQTSTFCFETVEEGQGKFAKTIPGFVYSRSGNPTNRALEMKIAALEGGEDAVATASGMGAIGAVMVAFLKTGDHVVCGDCVYGGTSVVMRTNLAQFGIDVSFVDTSDAAAVEAAIKPNTKLLYFETPTNPLMVVTDIKKMAAITKAKGIKLVVDNTFAPPPLQYPIKLGADLVVHSVTKYLNGHGDVLGGLVVGSKTDIALVRGNGVTKICGTPPSPHSSFLVLRGMKTLSLRVRQHCNNAMAFAQYLAGNKYIKKVYYPGLAGHPQHQLAKEQMNGYYTGMVAFEVDAINGLSSYDAGIKLLNTLTIPSIAVSLGDPDTLIQHPASMTHASVPKEAREAASISDGLIRMSVGLENVEDLIADFDRAFASM
ncbi:MAG: PLP-dependent aspartate aminotransferase family protein [Clostridiales bacterium]